MTVSDIIFLDAEFTDRNEMLELSMYNLAGEEVYHSYFKPARAKSWRLEPHHITPAMVEDKPSFAAERPTIQSLLDRAGCIAGFAVDNDIRRLTAEGIEIPDTWPILEGQKVYWRYRSMRDEEFNTDHHPGLTACCTDLGIEVDPEREHSASGDTYVTRLLILTLLDKIRETDTELPENTCEAVLRIHEQYEEAARELLRKKAHGYVRLVRTVEGHYFVRSSTTPRDADGEHSGIVAEIEVADRFTAEWELTEGLVAKLEKKMAKRRPITDADIEPFRVYTVEYDEVRSRFHAKMLRQRIQMH